MSPLQNICLFHRALLQKRPIIVVLHTGWLRLVGSIKLQVAFAEYLSLLQGSFTKETYNFINPTNRSHPIRTCSTHNEQHNAIYRLQRIASRCNTLQHTATHCNVYTNTVRTTGTTTQSNFCRILKNDTLQRIATQCNALQHTATHYIRLQHTHTHTHTHTVRTIGTTTQFNFCRILSPMRSREVGALYVCIWDMTHSYV